MTKLCPSCKESKPLQDYHKDSSRPLGVQVYCKSCVETRRKKYYVSAGQRVSAARQALGGAKICATCGESKTLDEFKSTNRTPDNLSLSCLDCLKNEHCAKRYRMSAKEYREFIANGCEVCGTHESLTIDHDHSCCPDEGKTCGKCVRGVLCQRHNLAEGNLRGSADEALALAAYILRRENILIEGDHYDRIC